MKYQYLSSCASLEAIDSISTRVFIRLSYEYGILIIKRQLIPTLGSIALKTIVSNLNSIRDDNDDMAYVNIHDILILGLIELNFDKTEKATNILPDFRLGKKGCELLEINYEEYNKTQKPLKKFKGKIISNNNKSTWNEMLYLIRTSLYGITNILIDHDIMIDVFLRIFLEETMKEIKKHKNQKNYSFKLYDLLYFEFINGMIALDSLPEYKLMVKNDSRLEDSIITTTENNSVNHTSNLYF